MRGGLAEKKGLPKEAVRLGSLYTILTKSNRLLTRDWTKEREIWGPKGGKLWGHKYMKKSNSR